MINEDKIFRDYKRCRSRLLALEKRYQTPNIISRRMQLSLKLISLSMHLQMHASMRAAQAIRQFDKGAEIPHFFDGIMPKINSSEVVVNYGGRGSGKLWSFLHNKYDI